MTEKEIRSLFGYNLKRLRKQKNISQMRLADMTDMNFTFISDIENGKKWVSPDTIAKLTEALCVEAHQFFMPADCQPQAGQGLVDFAKDLQDSFRLLKSRYNIP